MKWIITISEEERRFETLSASSLHRATEAFREFGVVLLRGIFDRNRIDEMYSDYQARYGAMDQDAMRAQAENPPPNPFLHVGSRRFEIAPQMTGALGSPDIYGGALLQEFLRPTLGKSIQLNSFTTVVSHPGAELQHIHRDAPLLFPETQLGAEFPAYAINAAAPLIDVEMKIGPTGFWPGSHKWAPKVGPKREDIVVEPLFRGDCLLIDYRTYHAGLPNTSDKVRPILYMVFARSWFFDEVNHRRRNPVNIALEDYAALPERLQSLLTRGFVQAVRNQQPAGDVDLASLLQPQPKGEDATACPA
jgi:hypothetical protein